MLTCKTEGTPRSNSESLLEQTVSLSIILREEFGVTFTFYDTASGEPVGSADTYDGEDSARPCQPCPVKRLAANRVAQVTPGPKGTYDVSLPLGAEDPPCLLGIGSLTAFARTKGEEVQEQDRLEKWARSVCDRINLTSALPARRRKTVDHDASGTLAWESLVTLEQLMRRLRFHKDSLKHQKRILRTAADLVRAKAVVWVPQKGDVDVLIGGECSLSSFDLRQLAYHLFKSPDLDKSGILLVNDFQGISWAGAFPQINNLAVVLVRDHGISGLLIAVNKHQTTTSKNGTHTGAAPSPASTDVPVRRSDALALAPFASLFGMYTGVSLRFHDLKELLVGMTRSLTSAIDAKDAYTFGHSERVGRIAVELGRALKLSDDELNDLYLAGLMHDIGKIGIRDSVLCKREPLTPDEMEHLRQHVTIGHAIVADLHPIRHLFPGILYHHERIDGGGYPEGLKGDAIPIIARILAVADAYDAMTTTRPYRVAMTHDRACRILQEGAGAQWDKAVVDAFLSCREKIFIIRQRGVGESLRHAIDGALRNEGSSRQTSPPSLLTPTR